MSIILFPHVLTWLVENIQYEIMDANSEFCQKLNTRLVTHRNFKGKALESSLLICTCALKIY